ncbi:hypothetical protein JCM8097_000738 [Rhodosporidiobolus ruineniae]
MAPPRPTALQAKMEKDDPTLLPSDDEDDQDFNPDDVESASDDDSDDDDQHHSKRTKVEQPVEPAMSKSAIDDLWASFNDDSTDPYSATGGASAAGAGSSATGGAAGKGKAKEDDKVLIENEYEYVGEKITQERLVLRSSAEAQAWLARYPKATATSTGKPAAAPAPSASTSTASAAAASASAPAASAATSSSLDALFGPSSGSSASPAPTPVASSSSAPAPAPQPGPPKLGGAPKRKAGGGLAAAAAKLGVGKKPAKLNTLEKSKLDWNNHVTTTGDSDDLATARRNGFLEKKDFLDRVEGKREEEWERLKAGRRGQK